MPRKLIKIVMNRGGELNNNFTTCESTPVFRSRFDFIEHRVEVGYKIVINSMEILFRP